MILYSINSSGPSGSVALTVVTSELADNVSGMVTLYGKPLKTGRWLPGIPTRMKT